VRDRLFAVFEARRPSEARDRQDLTLVQRLALEERPGERIELPPVLREESPGSLVALPDDPLYFGVDLLGGLLAVGFRAAPGASGSVAKKRVLARREGDHVEIVAHAPAYHHSPHDIGGLLDVVLGARGAGTVDDLFGATTA
jgi:hypothetical protein